MRKEQKAVGNNSQKIQRPGEPVSPDTSASRGVLVYRERLVLGASGRAILAFRDQDRARLKALTQGIDISLDEYENKLERTRQLGYATSREELIAGAVAIAAPFFDGSDQAAGSLSAFGPSVRLSDERVDQIGQLLKHECEELSLALGFRRQ